MPSATPTPWGPQFIDVTAAAGLDFIQISGNAEQRYILESMSSGAAFFDYDGDRYQDLFFVNSTRLQEAPEGTTNRLYRNIGAGQFRDVTAAAGLQRSGWGMGCAVGDYDNDGDVDLYITYWGANVLYRNDGNGAFHEVAAGVEDGGWGTSAAFGDIDSDGWLDLFVANYVVFDENDPPGDGQLCTGWKGLEVYCGPHGMEPQANVLYRNDGDGGFTDMSAVTGIDQHRQASLGIVFADLDNDADQDLYVANDGYPNLLYRNDGAWHLVEVGAFAGAAYSQDGRAQSGMGVAVGDYDNDGDLDLYVTHFSDDVNTLYQNQTGLNFVDFTAGGGLGGAVRPFLGWGTGFFDADNDGWLDLFVVNGHIYPQVDSHPSGPRYGQRNLLYRNLGGAFREVGSHAGPGFAIARVSRGAAVGDYDNDGDSDLLVINLNEAPTLLHNVGGNRNNWLGLELVGTSSNADGQGARVHLWSGGRRQIREVQRGYGYLSQNDTRVLFGLGAEEQVDRVEIRWPSGEVQTLTHPPLRRYLVVREDTESIADSYGGPSLREQFLAAQAPAHTFRPDTWAPTGEPVTGTAQSHYRRGLELHRQSRHEESVHVLEMAIALNPDRPEFYYTLGGVMFAGMGRAAAAALVLERAIERDSTQARMHALLGEVYLELARTADAVRALTSAVALDPDPWEVHHRLGLTYLRADALGSAESAFHEAARRAPWEPHPHLQLARMYQRQGRIEAAGKARVAFERLRPAADRAEGYRKVLAEAPDNMEARYLLGCTYFEQGRAREARRCFQHLIDADSTYAQAHYGMAAILHQQGNLDQAIIFYERAYYLDVSQTQVLADLAQAYHLANQLAQATATYRRVLELRPELLQMRVKLGLSYVAQGRLGDAARAFETSPGSQSAAVQLELEIIPSRVSHFGSVPAMA
jgi:tetratricopeptide (TPR) repeat protein